MDCHAKKTSRLKNLGMFKYILTECKHHYGVYMYIIIIIIVSLKLCLHYKPNHMHTFNSLQLHPHNSFVNVNVVLDETMHVTGLSK